MSQETTTANPTAPTRHWPLLVFLVAVAVYAGTVTHGFVFDDQITVVDNPYVRSLDLPGIFSRPEGTRSGLHQLYRPLLNVTFAINYAVTALEPWSYHVFNVLLHGLVSVLVLFLAREWRLPPGAALAGALLFAVHPVHVEAVANVTGRKDALVAFFVLAMAVLHPRARREGGAWLLAPVVCLLGALFAKENGVAALGIVAAQDVLLRSGRTDVRAYSRRTLILYSGYAAALAVFLWARWHVVGGFGLTGIGFFDNPLMHVPFVTRVMTAIVVVAKGLALLVWPVSQSPDYSYNAIPLARGLADPRLLASVAMIFAIAAVAAAAWRRGEAIPAMAAGWYFVALFPTANLAFPVGTIFGERLLYLPSVGFCLLAGWALSAATRRGGARVLPWITVVAIVLLGGLTLRYAAAWRSDLALFEVAAQHAPNSTKTHYKRGELLSGAGRREEALGEMRRAAEIAPDSAVVLYGLATALRDVNRLDEARDVWLRVLNAQPNHAPCLGDLGTYYSLKGDYARAVGYAERAVAVDASLASSWYNLGVLYRTLGRRADARRALEQFIRMADPNTFRQEIEQAQRLAVDLR